jgi:FMN phosphatase YigB (HAD superfamily)
MLFIDDIADNINAAKNAGMQAVKFEKPGQLEDILKTFGVLL